MNIIFVNELTVDTLVGIYEWELVKAQPVIINLEMSVPSITPFTEGNFAEAIDYAAVVARLKGFLADHPCKLLEHLAEAIANLLMQEFKAPWVKVSLAKPHAIAGVKQVGVRIERGVR